MKERASWIVARTCSLPVGRLVVEIRGDSLRTGSFRADFFRAVWLVGELYFQAVRRTVFVGRLLV